MEPNGTNRDAMIVTPYSSDSEDLRRLGRSRIIKLLENDGNAEAFSAWLARALQAEKPSRTALNIWHKLITAAGLERNVTNNVILQLGVKDESEARRLIELGRRTENLRNDASMTLEQYHDEALDIAEICWKQEPSLKEKAKARLGIMRKIGDPGRL